MSTAKLIDHPPAAEQTQPQRAGQIIKKKKRKTPVALRPLHRAWRRAIDEIEVTRIQLPVRGLPPTLEGVVACQISDFHVDRDEDLARLEAAVELINRAKPDFVFLARDYLSDPKGML